MEVRFFSRRFTVPVGRLVLAALAILLAAGLFSFGAQVVHYYRGIKAGEANPLEESRLQASFSKMVANGRVTDADLERLVQKDAPRLGPKDAKLTVVEFLDFDCPFCRAAFAPLREAMQTYQDRVAFVIRDFPITELHPRAMPAALAARCAQAQGKYWPYHDKLYVSQDNHEDADLLRYAQEIGLNETAFQTCYEQRTYLDRVNADLTDGLAVGVAGTPTFFFNGVRVQGALDAGQLDQLIQRFLKAS